MTIAPAPSSPPSRPPLAGVRVLDLTRLLPGPMGTLHLADLGADVIKIEDLGAGDYAAARRCARSLNRNKRAIRIDLKQPGAPPRLLRLAATPTCWSKAFAPA